MDREAEGEMNNNFKLEKGMYQEPGRSFSQVLESIDPSDKYIGTPLEGLDAFQRQLKRFDIKVRGLAQTPLKSSLRQQTLQCCSRNMLQEQYVIA